MDDQAIGCYEMLGDQGTVAIVGSDGRSPEAVCADLWRQGEMSAGTTDIPPLTTCVTDGGGAAVLPSSDPDVCESQGMRNLGDSYTAYEREEIRLRDALRGRLPQGQCFTLDEAEETVRNVVRDLGLDEWKVNVMETAIETDGQSGRSVEFTAACYSWDLGGEGNESRVVNVFPDDTIE